MPLFDYLLLMSEGKTPSKKKTTQGDRLAMAVHAMAIVPLIRQLRTKILKAFLCCDGLPFFLAAVVATSVSRPYLDTFLIP